MTKRQITGVVIFQSPNSTPQPIGVQLAANLAQSELVLTAKGMEKFLAATAAIDSVGLVAVRECFAQIDVPESDRAVCIDISVVRPAGHAQLCRIVQTLLAATR